MTRVSPIASWFTALTLAASPLALSSHVGQIRRATSHTPEPAGLTVADGRVDGQPGAAVVTSLRSGGPAEHGGMAVGDEIRAIDGHRTRGAAAVRHDLHHARRCRVAIDLRRGGHRLVATVNRCGRGRG
jgi:S1-C subfamily serine protease